MEYYADLISLPTLLTGQIFDAYVFIKIQNYNTNKYLTSDELPENVNFVERSEMKQTKEIKATDFCHTAVLFHRFESNILKPSISRTKMSLRNSEIETLLRDAIKKYYIMDHTITPEEEIELNELFNSKIPEDWGISLQPTF